MNDCGLVVARGEFSAGAACYRGCAVGYYTEDGRMLRGERLRGDREVVVFERTFAAPRMVGRQPQAAWPRPTFILIDRE